MRLLAAALVLVLFPLAGRVHAEDRGRARQAFEEGRQHFDLGEYEAALEAFKRAYRNFEDPSILFNLAQCQRQLGNKEEAIAFYRKFLSKVPQAANRDEVQHTIEKLEAALAAERATKPLPPAGVSPPQSPALATTDAPAPTPLVKKWWLWTAVGGGVAAVALGVGLGLGLAHPAGTQFPGVTF